MGTIKILVDKYGGIITLLLVLILFFRSCGLKSTINNLNDNISELEVKVTQASEKIATIDQQKIMTEKLMWDFLEIEELADKKNISVSFIKHNNIHKNIGVPSLGEK